MKEEYNFINYIQEKIKLLFEPKIFILFSVLFTGCSLIGNNESPYIEISKPGYTKSVRLYNVVKSYSSMNNIPSSNIDELDEDIWDEFKGKEGNYGVVWVKRSKDNYGKEIIDTEFLDSLKLDELNKYQTLDDFKNDGGLSRLIDFYNIKKQEANDF